MDSGNSSSMQSSSGGEEDIDSKAESSSMTMSMSMSMPMPLMLDHHSLSLPNYYNLNSFLPSSLFDPPPHTDYLPNTYSQPQHPNPNPNPTPSTNLHLDTFRPASRPDPNCTDHNLPTSSSQQTMLLPQGQYQPSSSPTTDQTKPVKNPRKRTRASRRAPTTVLTTDTSNFRAMVQEFTGFPAPPFSGSRKLDLFGSGSIFRSSHHHPDPLGHFYPLRPSPHKLQQPPLLADASNPNANANNIINNALMSTITSSIAQMASAGNIDSNNGASLLNLPKHPSTTNQNPIALPNSNILSAFPSLMHDHDPLNASAGLLHRFGANSGPTTQDQFGADMGNGENDDNRGRSLNEDYGCGQQRVNLNGCKMNYTAASSSSDYHANEKGLENVSTRVEGTAVDNWFGPSD